MSALLDFSNAINDTNIIKEIITPVLIANATILAMTSLRNSDIATRIRNLVTEAVDSKTTEARRVNINTQIKRFNIRHILTSLSSFLLAIAVLGLSIFIFVNNVEWKKILIFYGFVAYSFSVLCLAVEFLLGYFTLNLNSKSATDPTHFRA